MAENKNENLIQELYKEMEAELEKDPDQMDTLKIRDIGMVLDRLEGREELPGSLKKETFFAEFDKKYGYHLHTEEKPERSIKSRIGSLKWKVAIAGLFLFAIFGMADMVSVTATDKSLIQLIKEVRHMAVFRASSPSWEKEAVVDAAVEQYEEYEDWDALLESLDVTILTPEYIPAGMELEKIEEIVIDDYVKINVSYGSEEKYLDFFYEFYEMNGFIGKNQGGKDDDSEYTSVAGGQIQFTEGEDFNASFVKNDILYVIDTDLGLEELEKIIENLK